MSPIRAFLMSWLGRAIVAVALVVVIGTTVVAPRLSTGAPQTQIRTQQVARGNVAQTVAVSGSVNATEVNLTFKPNGRLAEIPVKVGDAVTAGQALARLDPFDLRISVRQAEANVLSAQAKYDETVAGATPEDVALARNSLDLAQVSYEQTKKTTESDIVSARQALDDAKLDLAQAQTTGRSDVDSALLTLERTKATFAAARANFASLVAAIETDIAAYEAAIAPARASIADALDETDEILPTDDTEDARDSLNDADISLANAASYAGGVLQAALDELVARVAEVTDAVAAFETAVTAGADPTAAVSAYQTADYAYQIAASRLSSAVDVPDGEVGDALASVTSAGTSLDSLDTQDRWVLDDVREAIADLRTTLTDEDQLAGTIKTKVTQAGTSLATITSSVTSSYVAAQEAYDSAVRQGDTSLRSAQDALTSAQRALVSAQDKGASSVVSQEIALKNAQVTFQRTAAGPTATDVQIALASLRLAEIALDKAKADLDAATLRAPVAGVVASVADQVGEAPSSPFIVLAITSTLTLHGTVGEAEIAKLKAGQVATVAVDALGTGARLTGKVTTLDPIATISQGVPVYGVDVLIDVPDPAVRAGMSGTATVIVASKQGVLTVPNLAIRSQSGRRYVQVLRDGQAEDADVTFGIASDSVTEVTSGLEEGDQVVLPTARTTTTTTTQGGARFGPAPGAAPFR